MAQKAKDFLEKFLEKNAAGKFIARPLFPGAVSSVHPGSLTNMILKNFLELDKEDVESQSEYLRNELMEKYSADIKVQESDEIQKLVRDWIEQDLCFRSDGGKTPPKLKSISLHVPAQFPWKSQERYGGIVKDLLRSGRKNLVSDFDTPISKMINSFDKKNEDPLSSILYACLSKPKQNKWKKNQEEIEKYDDQIFCSAQGRIFQEDIENIFNWAVPTSLLSKWVNQIITFHLCTHYLKMSLLADDLANKAKIYIYTGGGCPSAKLSCERCPSEDPKKFQESCADCSYNPGYFINDDQRTQVWYEALNRYQENIAVLSIIHLHINDGKKKDLDKDFLKNFLPEIKNKYAAKTEEIRNILEELQEHLKEKPPKLHGWSFFSKYACTEPETKFATKHQKGKFGMSLSSQILMIFSHCFMSIQKKGNKPFLFTDFLNYLTSRGFKTKGVDTYNLENKLRTLGLMNTYSDMGAARALEPVLTEKQNA